MVEYGYATAKKIEWFSLTGLRRLDRRAVLQIYKLRGHRDPILFW